MVYMVYLLYLDPANFHFLLREVMKMCLFFQDFTKEMLKHKREAFIFKKMNNKLLHWFLNKFPLICESSKQIYFNKNNSGRVVFHLS